MAAEALSAAALVSAGAYAAHDYYQAHQAQEALNLLQFCEEDIIASSRLPRSMDGMIRSGCYLNEEDSAAYQRLTQIYGASPADIPRGLHEDDKTNVLYQEADFNWEVPLAAGSPAGAISLAGIALTVAQKRRQNESTT